MKHLLIVLGVGLSGTAVLYFSPAQEPVVQGANFKTIKYTSVNNQALSSLKSQISLLAEKMETKAALKSVQKVEETITIDGVREFDEKLEKVFNYLKDSQLVYRYEFYKSFDRIKSLVARISSENYEDLNAKINNLIDYHLAMVSKLKTTNANKNKITTLLNDIRNPFRNQTKVTETQVDSQPPSVTSRDVKKLLSTLIEIKKPSSLTMEFHSPETRTSMTPFFVLWGVLLAIAALIWKKEVNTSGDVVTESFQSDVNPTIKKIISELDYPLFVCDSGLNVTWQNNSSNKFNLNSTLIQNMITQYRIKPEETFDLEGKSFKIQISELNYKNGKKNLLVQMTPIPVGSKFTEHLIDATQVEHLLESSKDSEGSFKDFNQTIAELAVKMNHLFKVSGKFLDIDFKKDIADCFIENSRLETMCREFILSCHFIIKDKEQASGIHMRTDELGQRFALGCFLPGLSESDLTSGVLARDFLKKFSILEAKYSMCLPTIDIKVVSIGEVKGVDINLSFENRSRMESLINQSFATM